jgi:hypothetical protein
VKPEARIDESDKQTVFVKVRGGEAMFCFPDEEDAESFVALVNDWCEYASLDPAATANS